MVYDAHRARYNTKQWDRMVRVRVWLDGVEVTKRSFYADPRRGVVRRYVTDASGALVVDQVKYEIVREELRGRVVVRRAA
jgi:hypothetical protein